MRELTAALREWQERRTRLSAEYQEPFAIEDISRDLAEDWRIAEEKMWLLRYFASRSILKRMAETGGASGEIVPDKDLPLFDEMASLHARVDVTSADIDGVPANKAWCDLTGLSVWPMQARRSARPSVDMHGSFGAHTGDRRGADDRDDANEMTAGDAPLAAAIAMMLKRFDAACTEFVEIRS